MSATRKAKEEMPKFTFLFVARMVSGNLKEIAAKVPKDCDLDDGAISYYWETKCKLLSTAVDRAAKRCAALRERSGLDWQFDDEFDVEESGKSKRHSFFDNKVESEKLEKIGLW